MEICLFLFASVFLCLTSLILSWHLVLWYLSEGLGSKQFQSLEVWEDLYFNLV